MTENKHRQQTAQKLREARTTLAGASDKTAADHVILFVLGLIEEHLSETQGRTEGGDR